MDIIVNGIMKGEIYSFLDIQKEQKTANVYASKRVLEGKCLKKVVIGIVGCLLLIMLYVAGTFVYQSTFAREKIDEEKTIELGQIKSIDVRTSSANIRVLSNTTDQIKINVDGEMNKKLKEQYQLIVEEVNGQLVIEYLANENTVGIKFGSENDITISILLPEKDYQRFNMVTSSGNIEVENLVADNIEITTTSGSQSLIDSEIKGDAMIQSTSGDIVWESSILTAFQVNTTSGKVKTKALAAKNGRIETTSGNVTLNMGSEMEEIQIETTSGDVAVDYEKNPDSLKLTFAGSSGKSDINLPGMMYDEESENSAIGVLGDGSNILDVKTTSGDLVVH